MNISALHIQIMEKENISE